MIVIKILCTILDVFVCLYLLADLFLIVRNNKYQKKWNKEKANIIRIDPAITYPQLCEKYVLFRKKNSCNVEF